MATDLGGQERAAAERLRQQECGRAMVLLAGHGAHRHEDGDDDPELAHVLRELHDGVAHDRIRDDTLELVAPHRIDDLPDVARHERRHEAEDREDDEDHGRRSVRTCSRHLLAEEKPQAAHRLGSGASCRRRQCADRRSHRLLERSRSPRRARGRRPRAWGGPIRSGRCRRPSPRPRPAPRPWPHRAPRRRHGRCHRSIRTSRAQGAARSVPTQSRLGSVLPRLRFQLEDGPGVADEQLVDGSLGDEASPIDDRDAIADTLDVVEDVRAHEDGGGPAQAADELEHVAAAGRIEGADGLVEEEHGRPREDGLAHAEPLSHTARVAPDAPTARLRQPDGLEHVVDACAQAPVRRARRPGQRARGAPVRSSNRRSGAPDRGSRYGARARAHRSATGTPATLALPLVGRPRPVSRRSVVVLPAPFGPRKPKTEPLGTVRSSAVEGDDIAVPLAEPSNLDGRHRRGSHAAGHHGQAVASSRPTMK